MALADRIRAEYIWFVMRSVRLLFVICLLFPVLPTLLMSEDVVEIYSDYNPREYGRAMKRLEVLSHPLREFSGTRTLMTADPDGILTAVLLRSEVIEALDRFLDGFHERWLQPAWFWAEDGGRRKVYYYYDNEKGVRVGFSVEKAESPIFDIIDKVYSADEKSRKLVHAAYAANYILRIHAAENVVDPWLDEISYEEALIAATLLGDSFQPLWGIRNGYGLLSSLPELVRNKTSLTLVNYRPLTKNETEYLAFIGRTTRLAGGFVRNLHAETMKRIERSEALEFQLPEELIPREKGRGSDIALLYYDVLTRKGFQVRLCAVRNSPSEDPLFITLYREGSRGNWGALTEHDHVPDVSADWTRVPSLVIGAESIYTEIDPALVFTSRRIRLPEVREWKRAPD
jgi:hypothetical protein